MGIANFSNGPALSHGDEMEGMDTGLASAGGEDFSSTPSPKSTGELPRLSPLQVSNLQVLKLHAEMAQMRLQHQIEMYAVALGLPEGATINLATGEIEVR